MTSRLPAVALLAVVLLVCLVVYRGGDGAHRLDLELTNATGLTEGAPVTMGSVEVGNVKSLRIDGRDRVVAQLSIEDRRWPLGEGATASIRSANLLGSQLVELTPGNTGKPLSEGATIPRTRVRYPVDIQDVLDVLDAETRTQLAALVNEAGYALTGRKTDFNTLLARLPRTLDGTGELVSSLMRDNEGLARVVDRSDSFIARITRERQDLSRLVRSFGGTFETIAARRRELRQTLRQAPATLTTARAFLADLEQATVPLAPAARAVRETAPRTVTVLDQLRPFEQAARPTLQTAIDVAPSLERLSSRATPVLRRAVPALRTLSAFLADARPASGAAGLVAPDLLGLIEGWSRAIQARDGIGHFFRANVSLSPDAVQSMLNKGGGAPARDRRDGAPSSPTKPAPSAVPEPTAPGPVRPRPPAQPALPDLPKVQETTDRAVEPTKDLLDALLKP